MLIRTKCRPSADPPANASDTPKVEPEGSRRRSSRNKKINQGEIYILCLRYSLINFSKNQSLPRFLPQTRSEAQQKRQLVRKPQMRQEKVQVIHQNTTQDVLILKQERGNLVRMKIPGVAGDMMMMTRVTRVTILSVGVFLALVGLQMESQVPFAP